MNIRYILLFILILAISGCQTAVTVAPEQQNPQVTVIEPEPQMDETTFREIVTIEDGNMDIEVVNVPLNTDAEVTFVNNNRGNESSVRLVSDNADVYLRAKEQYILSLPAQNESTLVYYEVDERIGTIRFG